MQLLVDGLRTHGNYGVDPTGGPRDWHAVVELVAQRMQAQLRVATWRDLCGNDAAFLAWSPSMRTAAIGLAGRSVVYVCWGVAPSAGMSALLRRERLKAVLRGASVIAVNEPVTGRDVYSLVGKEPRHLPHVVDTDYFQPSSVLRGNLALVPGDKDRDEKLVLELARRGTKIIRIARSQWIRDLYSGLRETVDFRASVPNAELRALYQTARCVLLPVTSARHPAGQTSLLEALACGAPVVISAGRAAAVAHGWEGVLQCRTAEPQEWLEKISEADYLATHRRDALENTAKAVAERHHPEQVINKLVSFISEAVTSRRVLQCR